MTPELEALAVRCEQASGPDRRIDRDIFHLIVMGGRQLTNDEQNIRTTEARRGHLFLRHVEPYTASLDAAMTLALPSWWFSASLPLSPDAYGYSREDLRKPRAGFQMIGPPYSAGAIAATLPLAIVAACLKARASTPTQNHKGPHDE